MEEEDNIVENIVYNPDAAKTNFVAVESDPEKDPKVADNPDIVYDPKATGFVERADKRVGIDLEDFTGYLGHDLFLPEGEDGVAILKQSRAINQPWYEQAGAMVGQAVVGEIVGGTIEGLGYLLDVDSYANIARGEELEWGNWLSDVGKGLREGSQEAMPIFQQDEGGFNMSDSGWWFSNGVSVASSLSMLIPSFGATKALGYIGKGASKVAGTVSKSLDIASRMGKQQRWMTKGITQAVVSRHIENSMEASGTFDSSREEFLNEIDPETGVKFTDEKATQLAADAAASNYKLGWAMIMQDIPQYLALGKIFNPNTMKMENALSKAMKSGKKVGIGASKGVQKLKGGLVTFGSEGFEESYQYLIAERGKLLSQLQAGLITEEEYDERMSDKIGDDEMLTSAFWGGLGGNLFQVAGKGVSKIFDGKVGKAREVVHEQIQAAYIEQRGKNFTMLQKELAIADQEGDKDKRKVILNEMMLGMTLDAVEMDRFNEHIEALENLANMDQEEANKFASEQGVELNQDLLRSYIPEMVQMSKDIRKKQLKYQNKHDKGIASALTRNDMHIALFGKKIKEHDKISEDLIAEVPGYNSLTGTTSSLLKANARLASLQNLMKVRNAEMKTAGTKFERENINESRQEVERLIDITKKDITDLKKNKLTAEEKKSEKKILAAYDSIKDELHENEAQRAILDDTVYMKYRENKFLKTDEYGEEKKKADELKAIKALTEDAQIKTATEAITNSNYSEAEKKHLLGEIKKQAAVIERKRLADEAKASAESHEEDIVKGKKETDTGTTVPNTNTAPIADSFDDPFADEESTFDDVLDKDDKADEVKADSHKTIKLLDNVGSENFNAWAANGADKAGTKILFVQGDPVNDDARKAIEDFNAGNISDHTIDYYPIKVVVGSDPSLRIHSFLPSRTASNVHFDTNERPQRKAIINGLKEGPVESKVFGSTGGGLLTEEGDPADFSAPPSNNIMELQDYRGGVINDLEILVTDEMGLIMNTDKDLDTDFAGKQLMVTGSGVPYKGGVFLKISKANGDKFPLRLNIARHSFEEAESVTDLLIGMGVTKTIKHDDPFSSLPKEIQDEWKENHPEVLKALGTDPTAIEMVNFLTYVSEETKGLASELYMSGVHVRFDGKFISPENIKKERGALVDFLVQKKRKQFNLNLWNTSPAYKEYMVNNKVISTNAVIEGATFGPKDDRKVTVYVDRINQTDPDPAPVVKATGSKEFNARVVKSKSTPIAKDEFSPTPNLFQGRYFVPASNPLHHLYKHGKAVTGKTVEEVQNKIDAMYNAELKTVKTVAPKKEEVAKKPGEKEEVKEKVVSSQEAEVNTAEDLKDVTKRAAKNNPNPKKVKAKKTVGGHIDKEKPLGKARVVPERKPKKDC